MLAFDLETGTARNHPKYYCESVGFSEEIVAAVNNVLIKHCSEIELQNSSPFYTVNKYLNTKSEVVPAVMQSDKTILCEFNVGLWDKSLVSAINDLTCDKYPHYSIIQEFINYLLNGHLHENHGLLEEFFYKLLMVHPPRPETRKYYQDILCSKYVTFNGKCVDEKGMFESLLDALLHCLKDPVCSDSLQLRSSEYCESFESSGFSERNSALEKSNSATCFVDLNWSEKVMRLLTALNFARNALECDLAFCTSSSFSNATFSTVSECCGRPLFSHVLWPDKRDVGFCGKVVNKVLNTFILGRKLEKLNFPHFSVVKRLLELLIEVLRIKDKEVEALYPHVGVMSNDLARELSTKFVEVFNEEIIGNEQGLSKFFGLIRGLKSAWFRLLLCSHLLSSITGHNCSPELNVACDIFACVTSSDQPKEKPEKAETAVDWKRIQKLRARSSVNIKRKGKTRLQSACEKNDVEEVKALLMFPELDVNAVDGDGWTALHIACQRGSASCVRELVLCVDTDKQKGTNLRAKGPDNFTPLMCAVLGGHTEICHLLLQQAGSVLLDDVNDSNYTALDLSRNEEITRILNHYQELSERVSQGMNIEGKYRKLVVAACVEMTLAYFATHRTWDVWKALEENERRIPVLRNSERVSNVNPRWDYKRYDRDLRNNIWNLKKMNHRLSEFPEFRIYSIILNRVLSMVDISKT